MQWYAMLLLQSKYYLNFHSVMGLEITFSSPERKAPAHEDLIV